MRLFFAIWPDAKEQHALLAEAKRSLEATQWRGRWQDPNKLHLTLQFLGSLPCQLMAELMAAAGRLLSQGWPAARAASAQLRLDRLEYWPRSKVLCATASHQEHVQALHERLAPLQAQFGRAADPQRFRAHVTVGRGESPADLDALDPLQTVTWGMTRIALVRSVFVPMHAYVVLRQWQPGAPAGDPA